MESDDQIWGHVSLLVPNDISTFNKIVFSGLVNLCFYAPAWCIHNLQLKPIEKTI